MNLLFANLSEVNKDQSPSFVARVLWIPILGGCLVYRSNLLSNNAPQPLTVRFVPTGVLSVGSLAGTTNLFKVKGVSTSMIAMSNSSSLVPYLKFPPIMWTLLTPRFCWVGSVTHWMPEEELEHLKWTNCLVNFVFFHNILVLNENIFYLVLAPAIIVDEAEKSDVMQWAAVSTKMLVKRVPPQISSTSLLFEIKTCHGFEFFGLSMDPLTIRSGAKEWIRFLDNMSLKKNLIGIFKNARVHLLNYSMYKFVYSKSLQM